MSDDYAARRRLLYALDSGVRARRRNEALKTLGLPPKHLERQASWARDEVCSLLGVHVRTFRQYVAMGIVPKATHPGSQPPRYWTHQVLLLVDLFKRMRIEGWPRRMPHFIGSPYWTDYFTKLRSEWGKEPPSHDWKARSGNDYKAGKNASGECARV